MATNLSPKQAEALLTAGAAILIDVREGELFKNEHIIYASSLPLDQVTQQLINLEVLPKKIIFQCMKGMKSAQACELAKALGDKVYNLEGGIEAWKAAGLPVLTAISANTSCGTPTASCSGKLSIVRQMQITLGIVLLLIYLLAKVGLGFLIYLVPLIGIVLIIAGLAGCCPIMKILARMPWNKP